MHFAPPGIVLNIDSNALRFPAIAVSFHPSAGRRTPECHTAGKRRRR